MAVKDKKKLYSNIDLDLQTLNILHHGIHMKLDDNANIKSLRPQMKISQ